MQIYVVNAVPLILALQVKNYQLSHHNVDEDLLS